MKKLNLTKEQYNRSPYLKNKYGSLKYVSESGKFYKTDKGNVLMFKEAGPVGGYTSDELEDELADELDDGYNPDVEGLYDMSMDNPFYKKAFKKKSSCCKRGLHQRNEEQD